MATFLYEFEWYPVKARANLNTHGLDFERAATVFLDPLALNHPGRGTERSRGPVDYAVEDATDRYVLVVHTFEPLTDDRGRIRLISARRPTKSEFRDYDEQK